MAKAWQGAAMHCMQCTTPPCFPSSSAIPEAEGKLRTNGCRDPCFWHRTAPAAGSCRGGCTPLLPSNTPKAVPGAVPRARVRASKLYSCCVISSPALRVNSASDSSTGVSKCSKPNRRDDRLELAEQPLPHAQVLRQEVARACFGSAHGVWLQCAAQQPGRVSACTGHKGPCTPARTHHAQDNQGESVAI